MKFIHKTLASCVLFTMSLTLISPVIAAANLGFTDDIEITSWTEEAIEELIDQGVLAGNPDGSFAPNRQLNRAEVSKIIVLMTKVELKTSGGPHFPDVSPDAWYYDYIETMYHYEWINGYPDGLFRPEAGINRAEIAKMIVKASEIEIDLSGAPHFDDASAKDWYYEYVETAYNYKFMRGLGDGGFHPQLPVTRAQTAKIVYDGLPGFESWIRSEGGTLEANLSHNTPPETTIPYNATSVPYTTVDFTASDDTDVEISALTFTRLGLGAHDDFESVWLEMDGQQVGQKKSVNSDDIVEFRFNPPIVIPAAKMLEITVMASMKYTATDKNIGHSNHFALLSSDNIVSTASHSNVISPIEGKDMKIIENE